MPVGEPGGRALEADAVPLAVELARELKRPVQLSLSPSGSQNHDRVAPAALARMTALPGAGGITAAWRMRVATSDGLGSAIRRLAGADETNPLGRTALDGAIPPYAFPDVSIEALPVKSPFPTGYMRGHSQRAMTFFTESFIDELAHAAAPSRWHFEWRARAAIRGSLAASMPRRRRAAGDGGGGGSTLGLALLRLWLAHRAAADADHRRRPDSKGTGCRSDRCGRIVTRSWCGSRSKAG